ncbi:MAG: pyridoxine 5'-phosphate synthase [Deltaproteobacteria bacterium]
MPLLGVNIDHVATLRQQRRGLMPDVLAAARSCERAGADSIVVHLREDRRHIQDADVRALRARVRTRLNLEMSLAADILDIACRVKPDQATLVPEKRRELTTEGGLDVVRHFARVRAAAARLARAGVEVSLFIEPAVNQIRASAAAGARAVEFHTGRYADAGERGRRPRELEKIRKACRLGRRLGLYVHAGHGLDYDNVRPIAAIDGIRELNIGYSIVCRAVFTGLEEAVRQMRGLIR